MFFRHEVSDYPAWRSVYDSIDDTRTSMGVIGQAVFRSTADDRDVTGWHDFESEDAAQAFASSPALHEAMGRAGVQGAPQIWFTTAA